jgi:hypothetical protein
MKTLGNCLYYSSAVAAMVLSIYGACAVIHNSKSLAVVAVVTMVAWFSSLAIRGYMRRRSNAS